MTCKDCFHCDVCLCNDNYDHYASSLCDHFKNKADVVKVVRCKECVYANDKGDTCYFGEGRFVTPEHYCSNGERKCEDGI